MWSRPIRFFGGSSLALRRLLGLAFSLVVVHAANADIQTAKGRHLPKDVQPQAQPPSGVSQTVQIGAAGQTEIILEAHGQEGKIIDFTLKDPPLHGKLGELHPLTRNTASVSYVRNPGDETERDAFTFVVQARGSLVSAPSTVSLEMPAPAPRLVASPGELDFGAVNVGEVSRARITLENQGGGVAIGHLSVPTPWEVEEGGDYRLAKNEKKVFQLVFRPGADRVFEDEIDVGRNDNQRARLVGTGVMVVPKEDPAQKAARLAAAEAAVIHVSGVNAPEPIPLPPPSPKNRVSSPASSAPSRIDYSQMGKAEAAGTNVGAPRSGNAAPVILNDIGVETLRWRWNDARNIKISWVTPQPPPRTYRVELRYLSLDSDLKLQVDWRAYAKLDIQTKGAETEAALHGLPPGTRQTIRVIAIDHLGQAAAPSEMLQVDMAPGFNWGITPMRVALALLAICLAALWYKRRSERIAVREIESLPLPSAMANH